MQKLIFLVLVIVTGFSSCQKTSTKPNTDTPPTPVDTTKPDNTDTFYLRESVKYYNYDQTGTNIIDSLFFSWIYDGQRRVTKFIVNDFAGNVKDTVYTSYGIDKNVALTVFFRNGILESTDTVTYFLNAAGKPDSTSQGIYSLNNVNGVLVFQHSYRYMRYYYNEAGQDTLERGYTIGNPSTNQFYKMRQTYKGNDLDSAIVYFDDSTVMALLTLYANGNIQSETFFQNGTPYSINTRTYLDILSRGFYGPGGDRQLVASEVNVFPLSAASNNTDNYTYTFDTHNRPILVTRTTNGILSEKQVWTYY